VHAVRNGRTGASSPERAVPRRRRRLRRGFRGDKQVVHQNHALVRVQKPVTPSLELGVLRGVRVVAVQKLHVPDLELFVRLTDRLAVLLLLPVVPVLAEKTNRLAVEQEQGSGWIFFVGVGTGIWTVFG
jgi:hypothetical protein